MKISPTQLKDVLLVELDVFLDARGFFIESYHEGKFKAAGIGMRFVQDNQSESKMGTLRGLHGQLHHAQAKLVKVLQGKIFDVAVDVRPDSPTFGKSVSVGLSGVDSSSKKLRCLYIPAGFLHGFCVESPLAIVEYKCSDFYDASDEVGVRWDDPDLAIPWPVKEPLLSPKDRELPSFREVRPRLEVYRSK